MLNLSSKKRYRFRLIIPAYPTFNIYSDIAKKTTALGPIYIASVVNQLERWDVEVIDENNLSRYGPISETNGADHEFLQRLRPADVVGFYGGLTSTIPRLYELAKFYKDRGGITIAGGQHFVGENIEEALSSSIDYVVIGEGEETIKELLFAILGKNDLQKIKGIAYLEDGKVVITERRPPITDFDTLPLPNFSLLRYAKLHLYPIGRIRGCGMDCEFCTVKGKPRAASSQRLLENIRYLVETYDARHFFIVDDLFGQYRDETIEFCYMLRDYQIDVGRRLDFTVQIRLDKAKDGQLLLAMREAGVNTVAIGFESPIEEELIAMNKKVKPEEMIELARIYHKFGFLVHGMFIFGYPLRDGKKVSIPVKERIRRFRRFIKQAKIDTVQVLLPCPLPGTELRHRLYKENRIYPLSYIGWEYYDGNFPLFEPDEPLTAQDLQNAIRKIMGKFYRFRYFFMIGLHILFFPTIVFFIHNIKRGWRRWYRYWRNNLLRFGGWVIIKNWTLKFKRSDFLRKLDKAKLSLKNKSLSY
ncbi:MAG: B12-binding domain-containing radical SAM protein [Candidatus Omnitrophica bacterium]|nr:B12-binding domain-containing radical SAM protein [Candidatus Omnitrophota bacterium]